MLVPFILAVVPFPITLDSISVESARTLHGRAVVATFMIAKPTYALRGRTILGAADLGEVCERTAVLRGNRFDLDQGQRVTVTGVLNVIDHPPAVVNRIPVAWWVEIRVEQVR